MSFPSLQSYPASFSIRTFDFHHTKEIRRKYTKESFSDANYDNLILKQLFILDLINQIAEVQKIILTPRSTKS